MPDKAEAIEDVRNRVEFCKLCGYNRELHETERVQWVTDECPGEWDD